MLGGVGVDIIIIYHDGIIMRVWCYVINLTLEVHILKGKLVRLGQ
jgi:hypothetical protein